MERAISGEDYKETLLYKLLCDCKKVFVFLFFFSASINLLMMFLPLYTMQVLDRVMSSGNINTLLMLTIITLIAFAVMALIESCRSFALSSVGEWLEIRVSPDIIAKSISCTIINPGISSAQLLRDIGTIRGFLTGGGVLSLFDAPWSLLFLIIMFMINSSTAFVAVFGIFGLLGLALWNEVANTVVLREINDRQVKNLADIDIATRNAEVLEAMGMTKCIIEVWKERSEKVFTLQRKISMRSVIISGITKFFRLVLQIAVIGVGTAVALLGHKTVGGIIASSILMGRVIAPFESAIMMWKYFVSARISYRRLQHVMVKIKDRSHSISLPMPVGILEVDRIVYTPFSYSKPTIKGISFSLDAGEMVGIIGPSASGKSTLVKLVAGVLKPISGVVRLDGADVYSWTREEFGQYIGYLPQDIELFGASIKSNIARMNTDINDKEVIRASKIAGVHEMILSLPDGYETVIGVGGSMLSGGQRQRIGLARALYGNIKLLILDEPNSNLDQAGEKYLNRVLSYAKDNKITVLVTTHKFPLLKIVDKIAVLQNGMLVSFGLRDEILSHMNFSSDN